MDKETREKIKQLKKQKKYEEIFANYGKKAYKRNTPYLYRKKDLNKLKKEGKFEDIFNKYGENEYNKLLLHARAQEIKEAQGSIKAIMWKSSKNIKLFLRRLGIGLTTTFMIATPSLTQGMIDENEVKYEKEIEAYNEKISKYAEEVKSMHLNDLQIFMKVMDDMWNNIQGYGTPQKDIFGHEELDLADEDGYGVCRNMAMDAAKKLNEIDERYNAKILNVRTVEGEYETANIERKQVETSKDTNEEERQEETLGDIVMDYAMGNHAVTLADLPEKDVTVVLDFTNAGIGVYENGTVKMFNAENKWDSKEVSTMLLRGKEGLEIGARFVDSFTNENSYEELEKEFGLEKQNEALEYVRNLKKEQEEKTKEEKFKESLKVEDEPRININQENQNTKNEQEIDDDMQL